MGLIELFLLSLGLSMDAFAVSVGNGLCNRNLKFKWTFLDALTFGVFQGVMPVLGYALGQNFAKYVTAYDHIIALVLLTFIGGKMLIEGIKDKGNKNECEIVGDKGESLSMGALMVQGVATSIDALAVGISFSALNINIVTSAVFITVVTFICSLVGVLIGKRFGAVLNKGAQIAGGIILIGIGVKIFIEHMFF